MRILGYPELPGIDWEKGRAGLGELYSWAELYAGEAIAWYLSKKAQGSLVEKLTGTVRHPCDFRRRHTYSGAVCGQARRSVIGDSSCLRWLPGASLTIGSSATPLHGSVIWLPPLVCAAS